MQQNTYFAATLVRSASGRKHTQRLTLEGLGLRRLHQTVYLKDTPAVRGMLYKVKHLLTVKPCDGVLPLSNRANRANQANRARVQPQHDHDHPSASPSLSLPSQPSDR